jgi:hypothetical protein
VEHVVRINGLHRRRVVLARIADQEVHAPLAIRAFERRAR